MQLGDYLVDAVNRGASDVFILPGRPVVFKIGDKFFDAGEEKLMPYASNQLIKEIYDFSDNKSFDDGIKDDDLAIMIPGVSRFRVNVFRQRFTMGAVIRTVALGIPDHSKINIPDVLMTMSNLKRGMVLITGTTGSGKSTTLACLINSINLNRDAHIITIEDPIEYRHDHKKSVVTQREIGSDTISYSMALRAALRQCPDVILVGEMRDHETIATAISAAETGHLLLSTLHTMSAASTVERIIDVFPSQQQNQIRTQLGGSLQAIVSQQLLPSLDGNVVPAFEILVANSAVRNLIREGKPHQLNNVIASSRNDGMISMDTSILSLYKKRMISKEVALFHANNPTELVKRL